MLLYSNSQDDGINLYAPALEVFVSVAISVTFLFDAVCHRLYFIFTLVREAGYKKRNVTLEFQSLK